MSYLSYIVSQTELVPRQLLSQGIYYKWIFVSFTRNKMPIFYIYQLNKCILFINQDLVPLSLLWLSGYHSK